jgi:hypothetical protein
VKRPAKSGVIHRNVARSFKLLVSSDVLSSARQQSPRAFEQLISTKEW